MQWDLKWFRKISFNILVHYGESSWTAGRKIHSHRALPRKLSEFLVLAKPQPPELHCFQGAYTLQTLISCNSYMLLQQVMHKWKVLVIFKLCCVQENVRLRSCLDHGAWWEALASAAPEGSAPHNSKDTIRWPSEHSCQHALLPELILVAVFQDRVDTALSMMIAFKIISCFSPPGLILSPYA